MNFIEALKSGKRFRHSSWHPDCVMFCEDKYNNTFTMANGIGGLNRQFYPTIATILDETGWEIVKEKKKIETTANKSISTIFIDNHNIPLSAKVTIEWEE